MPASAQPFDHLAETRRSIRHYLPTPVPRGVIAELIAAAHTAPSNFNRQPWHFLVADSPAWRDAIAQLILRGISQCEARDTDRGVTNILSHIRLWAEPLAQSPVLILAFYRPSPELVDDRIGALLDVNADTSAYNPNLLSLGMALQNLLLAAHERGLGTCVHSGPLPFLRPLVNRLLNLPVRLQLAAVVSLGYPNETPHPMQRRDVARVMAWLDEPVPAELR